jgi:transcriptional regulator with XRE-family HTH domain
VNDARSVMNIIRMDVYKHHPSAIAKAIGVSTGTIYAIRSGRTKWPRHETIFALAKYLGYRFVLERTR